MTSVSSTQLPPAFYRAPKEVQERFLKIREEGAADRVAASESDLSIAAKGVGIPIVVGATALLSAPLALAGGAVVFLTGCPGPVDPETGGPQNYDTEETLTPANPSTTPLVEPDGTIKAKNLNIRVGGTKNDGQPVLTVGIKTDTWGFSRLNGDVQFFRIGSENLEEYLDGKVAYGQYDTVYEGDIANHYVEKADVTGKSMAIGRLMDDATLYGPGDLIVAPVVHIEGKDVNPYAGMGGISDSLHWLTGPNASKFQDTGLAIEAPYFYYPDYPWSVWVYMKRMPISGETGNFVPDPREASVWAWPMDDWNQTQGIPMPMFAVCYPGTTDVNMFNVIPVVSSGTVDERINFLRTAMPRTAPGLAEIQERSINDIPADGNIYLVSERGNRYSGLMYTAPDGIESHRTQLIGMQIMVRYPENTVPSSYAETCDLNFIHQVADTQAAKNE